MTELMMLFEEQALRRPWRVAVQSAADSLTYADLDRRSRHVASALRALGVDRDVVVALSLCRSPDLIVAVLGVMRAGGACLPLDVSYPAWRIHFMLEDSCARLLVSDREAADIADGVDLDTYPLEELEASSNGAVLPQLEDRDLAYVLYTSGSTGWPKGVAMEWGPLTRLVGWQRQRDGQLADARTAQFAPISFDVAFQEVLSTLCGGGTLVLLSDADRRDPERLLRVLADQDVQRLFLPTAALHPIANRARTAPPVALEAIYVAGEQLRITPAIREWLASMPNCRLHNDYGPTETHVVTSHTLDADVRAWPDLPPIGSALPHVSITLLDNDRQPVEEGEAGELYIGGDCLARGYVNRQDLTEERFITNAGGEGRRYRTGDLGRQRNGCIEYLGRADRQVKIRGFRVELSEIEVALSSHPDVAESAVVAEPVPSGGQRLAGYVVHRDRSPNDEASGWPDDALGAELARFLRDRIPAFMVPTAWMTVANLPLTPSGKVDRQALPPIPRSRPALASPLVHARTRTEEQLAALWRRLLELDEVGVEDNFFDLGGNSLLIAHLHALLRDELSLHLPVVTLFEKPTIRALATNLDAARPEHDRPATDSARGLHRQARRTAHDHIAVVGIACRFPGAHDPTSFWRNLRDGVESIDVSEQPPNGFVHASGALPNIDRFDARFFGFNAREAALLDPQHRMFLECSWEALEDAACDPRRFPGRIGVFGGCGPSTYLLNVLHPAIGWRPDRTFLDGSGELQLLTSTDKDFLTSQVSYKLDLRGPSMAITAACATSLFAVHTACRSLLDGESDIALAGGASVPVPQLAGYPHEPGMVLSPDGRCRAFDERAAGTVFGSGVGVVALKRLKNALDDGDDVYAVIRGSAVNNDGANKVGMTAPSVDGQARVIVDALCDAGVDPRTVTYLEAHGTGTQLGDPVEVAALTRAFGSSTEVGWCVLGSVKTNVGHLGWASGMAGLIKTVLALRHRQLPPTLHFERPNPLLELDRSPFRIERDVREWAPGPGPRRAGVSAFGLGGANAHVVLEEAPKQPALPPDRRRWTVVPLSARTPTALVRLAGRHADHLAEHPDVQIEEVAHTLGAGRAHHEVRRAVVVRDVGELQEGLCEIAEQPGSATSPEGKSRSDRVTALFTGQGAEYLGMGRQLYDADPVFRAALDSFDDLLHVRIGQTAADLLYGPPGAGERLTSIDVAQPLVFAVQMSLVRLWESWGVRPDVVLGHSLGEFAAACTAGVFTPDDGLHLVVERGRLLKTLSDDAGMAAVFADEPLTRAVLAELPGSVTVSAENGPLNTTVSGSRAGVRHACSVFECRGIQTKELRVRRAGHSRLMEPILDDFEAAAAQIPMQPPRIDLICNVTGKLAASEVTTAAYWRRHLREPVRFADGLEAVQRLGVGAFIEIGPAPLLLGLAQAALFDHPGPWVPSLRPDEDDTLTVAAGLALLYESGVNVDWEAKAGPRVRRVHLPTYPFERERHWIDRPDPEHRTSATVAPMRTEGTAGQHENWLYQIDWKRVAAPAADGNLAATDNCEWLILADNGGVGSALVDELRSHGGRCVMVHPGDAASATAIAQFLDGLGHRPGGVVHLWGCDVPTPDLDAATGVVANLQAPVTSVLTVVRALANHRSTPPRLWLVTRGAQPVEPAQRPVAVAQAPLVGLARVIRLEHPDLRCTSIDLSADVASVIGDLANLLLGTVREPELAWHDGSWHAPRLVRRSAVAPPPNLAAHATYLVTGGLGGLGGLGLHGAQVLADRGARHLTLASRHQPSRRACQAIEALRNRGIEVVIAPVDVTDRAQVDDLIARTSCGPALLRGVLHCAGVLDDGVLASLDWQRVAPVLAPKVHGAWNLHAACAAHEVDLDFFVLYSSATSVLGNAGQASHAAANRFLDALAHHRRAGGRSGVAINWGAWSGVGHLDDAPGVLAELERTGLGSLTTGDGAALLGQHLGTAASQVAVLPVDWQRFLTHRQQDDPLFEQLGLPALTRPTATDILTRIAHSTPEQRSAILTEHVHSVTSEILGSSGRPPDQDRTLPEQGLDSLTAIQLRNRLQRDLACSLPPRFCFEHPTIRLMVIHLLDQVVGPEWITAHVSRPAGGAVVPTGGEDLSRRETAEPPAPLSVQQRRWLSLIREVNYGHRVVPVVFHTPLDRSGFHAALRLVVERHEVLRTRYPNGRPEVLPAEATLPSVEELFVDADLAEAKRSETFRTQVRACRARLGDPVERPSWTIRCLDLAGGSFVVLLGLQHLEFDGTSLSVFVDELREAYVALSAGCPLELPPAVQYREYREQQHRYAREDIGSDRSFFEGLFASVPATTTLPGQPGFGVTAALPSRRFTPEEPLARWEQVLDASRNLVVSPFSVLLASYAQLIARLTTSTTVVIGMITSARNDARFAATIGPFTAPFPVPIVVDGRSPSDLVQQCHRLVTGITARSSYPVTDLPTVAPAFAGFPANTYFTDTCINFTNYRREQAHHEPRVEVIEVLGPVSHPDFTEEDFAELRRIPGFHLVADVVDQGLRANYWYHADRFRRDEVARWAAEHRSLMARMLSALHGAGEPLETRAAGGETRHG